MAKLSTQEQVERILAEAEKRGITNNFLFVTTFKRYQVQIEILKNLELEIAENGSMIEIEYATGSKRTNTNPAIGEYNKTSTAANGTVSTLINIVKSFSDEGSGASKLNSLFDTLNGDD